MFFLIDPQVIDRKGDMGKEHGSDANNPEGGEMSHEHLCEITCDSHGCMDGRPVVLKARKVEGKWEIVMSGKEAAEVVEAKLPGGALGFIAVLERSAGVTQDQAIEITEVAMKTMGIEPQFHIDNDHGHFDFNEKDEAEIARFLDEQVGGCGFAARTWGKDGAKVLVQKLKERGWLMEVLDGQHAEAEAKQIDIEGRAINVNAATVAGEQAFSFNRPETKKALTTLVEAMTQMSVGNQEDFVDKSMEWFDSEFPAIARALRGIESVQKVE